MSFIKVDKFNDKFNKLTGNIYVVEEIVIPIDGVYESALQHDNIDKSTLNVYTGSKLTGSKVDTYILSTPTLTPWKTEIKIFSNAKQLYISYETQGDTVEAEDINNVQNSIVKTQESLNSENERAKSAEKNLTDNLNDEIKRAESSEETIKNNLNSEITRAKASEKNLTDNLNTEVKRAEDSEESIKSNLNSEITRAKASEKVLTDTLNNEISRAKNSENNINNIINTNKPIWDDKYTKNEIDNKISQVITDLDWKESVTTFNDLSKNYPSPQDGWTVNVKDTDITYRWSGTSWIPISANSIPLATSTIDGKMSKQDKIDHDDMNSKKHTHSNKSIIDTITQSLINNWNSAFAHVSDTIKHITSIERNNWNEAYSKRHDHNNKSILDIITQSLIDNWNNAYTHITDSVKHITSDERTTWNTVSNKSDKDHIHDDRYYTETEINSKITTINNSINGKANSSHTHDKSQITNLPSKLSEFINDKGFITTKDVDTSQNHTHSNKTIIDTITQLLIDKWNNAYSHITDTIKHITSDERKLWNTVSNKSDKDHIHDDRYYTESEINSKITTINNIINGKANSYHTHTKSNITDFPTSLPANGGNADTIGGKSSKDFLTHGNSVRIEDQDLNTLKDTGFYSIVNCKNSLYQYCHCIVLKWSSNSDTCQIIVPNTSLSSNSMQIRISDSNGNWSSWREFSFSDHNHDLSYVKKGALTWNNLKGV
ncbi:hypothetical protein [Clostridium butyricum]|uniref:hypothetical protein n=1 Tax=Clostridium butyricum TaxID=1492 RepID=UPI002ABDCA1B|nr:hypothetical protein [Clostridium butyricum]